MNKIFSLLCICSSIFLFGCDEETMRSVYQDAKEMPAHVVVETVSKLVTAESLFSSPQYEYTSESLEKLFLKNEYFILVEDYAFFYCYDKESHSFEDVEFDANYAIIGAGKLDGNLIIGGTPPFRAHWKELKRLSKNNRTIPQFKRLLDIQNGNCFEIQLNEEYLKSLPQNKLLREIPIERSEWEKMWKEMKNFTSPIEDLFDSIHSEEESE